MKYFDHPGPDNTDEILGIVREEIRKRGITHVVVASTQGDTGLKAAKIFEKSDVRVVVVTHNTGFKETGNQSLSLQSRREIEKLGGTVYTGTMVLRDLGKAIKNVVGYSESEVVAAVLRMFGQGMKVCVEITAMAADAGLVPPGDVIAVAGTGKGADTACVIGADSSNRFFEIKIREVLAKPRNF